MQRLPGPYVPERFSNSKLYGRQGAVTQLRVLTLLATAKTDARRLLMDNTLNSKQYAIRVIIHIQDQDAYVMRRLPACSCTGIPSHSWHGDSSWHCGHTALQCYTLHR